MMAESMRTLDWSNHESLGRNGKEGNELPHLNDFSKKVIL